MSLTTKAYQYQNLGLNVIPLDNLEVLSGLDIENPTFNANVWLAANGIASYGQLVAVKATPVNLKKLGHENPWLAVRPDGQRIVFVMAPNLKEPEITALPPSAAVHNADSDMCFRFLNTHLFERNGTVPDSLPIVWEG